MPPLTRKELFFGILLPLLIATLFLFIAFYLKQQELLSYFSPAWRFSLIVPAMCAFIFCPTIMTLHLFAILFRLLGFDPAGKKMINGLYSLVVMFTAVVPSLYIGIQLVDYNEALEARALKERGREAGFKIKGYEYRYAKGPDYRYTFVVRGASGKDFNIEISRNDPDLEIGDEVYIRYLPTNPNIYKQIDEDTISK